MASVKLFCSLLVKLLQFSTLLWSWGHDHMSCLENLLPSPITPFFLFFWQNITGIVEDEVMLDSSGGHVGEGVHM